MCRWEFVLPRGEGFSLKMGFYPADSSSSCSDVVRCAGGNLCCSIRGRRAVITPVLWVFGILESGTEERLPGADRDEVGPRPGHRERGNQPFPGRSPGSL